MADNTMGKVGAGSAVGAGVGAGVGAVVGGGIADPVTVPAGFLLGAIGGGGYGLIDSWFGGGGKKKKSVDKNAVARTQFVEQLLGLHGPHAHHLARQQIEAYKQQQQYAKQGFAPDPGDIGSWLQGRMAQQQAQSTSTNMLDPTARSAFFEKVYAPWMAQQAQAIQQQIQQTGNQEAAALKQSSAGLPAGYQNAFNLGAQRMTGDTSQVAGAAYNLANIMNDPQVQQIAAQMQADTAARNKDYLAQRETLTNQLAATAGGGLGNITSAASAVNGAPTTTPTAGVAAPATSAYPLGLPPLPNVVNYNTGQ